MKTAFFCRGTVAAALIICLVSLAGCAGEADKDRKINIVFRFDDYSSNTPAEMMLKIIEAFRKHEAPLTLAVIPFVGPVYAEGPSQTNNVPLSLVHREVLKAGVREGALDIALHGYSHGAVSVKPMSEFFGVDLNVQKERLTDGKKYLEGVIDAPVSAFVPPWNSYDLNTLRALKEIGFSTVSADKKAIAAEDSGLKYLPVSVDISGLMEAVEAAKRSSDIQPVIVVLFHIFSFKEVDDKNGRVTYQELTEMLDHLKARGDVRFLSLSEAVDVIDDLSAGRFMFNRRNRSLSLLLPAIFRDKEVVMLYQELRSFPKALCQTALFYLTLSGLVVTVVIAAGRRARGRLDRQGRSRRRTI